jgi:hypothetical protein
LAAFSLNHPAYASNTRFNILYELLDVSTGLAPASPVTNFLLNLDTTTLRRFDVYTDGIG